MISRRYKFFIGLLISIITLSGCGGGTSNPTSPTVKPLTTVKNSSTFNGEPSYVVDGVNATVQYWTDATSGKMTQALFKSKIEPVKTRVIYNTQSNMPSRIIDEITGNYVVINEDDTGRVDFLEYDSSNRYQVGNAVYIKDDKIYIGQIAGKPAFSGQLFGQLSGGSKSGSYTLIATDTSDLVNIREADAQFYDMVNNLFGGNSTTSSVRRVGAALPSTLNSVLVIAGTALVAGSYATVAGTAATVMAPAFGAAGLAMILSGAGNYLLDRWIDDNFSVDTPQKQEAVDISLSYLVDSAKNKISDLWNDVKSNLSDATQLVTDSVTSAKNDAILLTSLDEFDGSTDMEVPLYEVPQPIDAPPVISTQLVGQAAQSDGSVYMLTGTIDGSGEINANGQSNSGNDQTIALDGIKDSNGTLTGSYVTQDANGTIIDSGNIDGSEAALGTCQTSTGSGGQGTFSFSHVVGSGTGVVQFSYDAYAIPDAFTVSSASGQKFSTGGLVSGGDTTDINIIDEPVVFVSVTAPNSGTAWEYQLGCLTATTTATNGTGTATDQEPNNSVGTAQALSGNQRTVTGTVNNINDPDDIFSFIATSTGPVTVTLSGFTDDLDLYLAPGSLSTQYVSNNSDYGTSESITQMLTAGETYYIQVNAYDTRSATNSYTLSIQ